MTNSTALLEKGMRCLNNELGILDAERFVALLLREPFDYTKWRRENLFVNMSLDEIMDEADKYCKENTDASNNV
ncbi:MAG: hypothetical protein LBR97_06080 [Dysgonamonadaceae bacterium]|jgi:hypothetical protein|nr:hypothetical protein [Dysgonamonadaceae bacterium]